jgi:hypothetical protein
MDGAAGELSAAGAWALFAGFFIVALVVSGAMLFVFAYLTGWRALARRFPCTSRSTRLTAGGVIIGALGWNGPPLRIGLDEAGVVLRPMRPFDLAFRTVCIPWSAIVWARHRDYHFFSVLEIGFGPRDGAILGFLPSPAAVAIAKRLEALPFVAASGT